jgi:hypothetical protein
MAMPPEDNLTLQLRELVAEAEIRFGPHEPGWTLLSAYNSDQAIYTPCTLSAPHLKVARVILSENAQGDPIRTRFQLAHEAIHCLAPEARSDAVNIEEGVATLFSITASGIPAWYAQEAEAMCPSYYREALADVRQLLALNVEAIKLLRAQRLRFHQMTPDLLLSVLGTPLDLATRLCNRRPLQTLRTAARDG